MIWSDWGLNLLFMAIVVLYDLLMGPAFISKANHCFSSFFFFLSRLSLIFWSILKLFCKYNSYMLWTALYSCNSLFSENHIFHVVLHMICYLFVSVYQIFCGVCLINFKFNRSFLQRDSASPPLKFNTTTNSENNHRRCKIHQRHLPLQLVDIQLNETVTSQTRSMVWCL